MTRLCLIGPAFALACALAEPSGVRAQEPAASDWGYLGGDAFGERYSALRQINRGNVGSLRVAWTYRTGERGEGLQAGQKLDFAATPVLAYGLLYLSTPRNAIIALDPATGQERWRYDPRLDRRQDYAELTSRGVTAWSDPDPERRGSCRQRIFEGTLDAHLIAVDAHTGRPCADFGVQGVVSLATPKAPRVQDGDRVTSPPVAYRDLVIIGAANNGPQGGARGGVLAFDARSGALRWSFDVLPAAAEDPAAEDWQTADLAVAAGGIPWGPMSLDPGRGIVYVPTGAPSPDAFGGRRRGANRRTDSLLALDAETGKLLWDRQLVHHDLWGFDLAAQPTLVELDLDGLSSSAVIAATQSGMLFAFDRETGVPVFPFVERPVPGSRVPGELASPTQPYSTLPPLVPLEPIALEQAWGLTFWDRGKCRERIAALRNEGAFTPPDPQGTLVYPGAVDGVNWGGIAFDPLRQRVIVASSQVPFVLTLLERAEWERELREQRAGRGDEHAQFSDQPGTAYGLRREPLLSPFGVPCTPPPWGTLSAVDLKRRQLVWQVPLGSTAGVAPWWLPVREFGLPSLGGPVITAGDLVFIGAAADGYLRAYDVETGRELWKHRLPGGGQATPMTYLAGRAPRQYLVIAAGGSSTLGTPRGDWVVAFALTPPPQRESASIRP